jgi:DNA-binding phage protein
MADEMEELRRILSLNVPAEVTIATVAKRFNIDIEELRRRLNQRTAPQFSTTLERRPKMAAV